MEDLQGEDHQDKFNGNDDMEEDDEIVLAGSSGVKKLGEVRGSAFSKCASNEVALTMNVDSPEGMMGFCKLKEASQRKRMKLNANLKTVNGADVSSGTGVGAHGNKSGGGVGVKNSRNNGKCLSKQSNLPTRIND